MRSQCTFSKEVDRKGQVWYVEEPLYRNKFGVQFQEIVTEKQGGSDTNNRDLNSIGRIKELRSTIKKRFYISIPL